MGPILAVGRGKWIQFLIFNKGLPQHTPRSTFMQLIAISNYSFSKMKNAKPRTPFNVQKFAR